MSASKTINVLTVAALALLIRAPLMAQEQPGQLNDKDYKFLVKAARANQEEVQLGQLAQQKGTSQSVRDFGQRMVQDHNKAYDQLKQIAAQKGANFPTATSRSERTTIDHLQNVSGVSFDKVYAKDMVKDHRKDVKEFEKAAKDVSDPDLRAWAQKTLPILQEHLGMAEQMDASVKNLK